MKKLKQIIEVVLIILLFAGQLFVGTKVRSRYYLDRGEREYWEKKPSEGEE